MALQEQEKVYTADDLWQLSQSPEYADMRLELDDGELIVMSPSGGLHGGDAGLFHIYVGTHVLKHDLGYTTIAEAAYILFKNPNGKDIVYSPDVAYVRGDRLPDGMPEKFIPFAPDLAVEVVSPTDTADEIQRKVENYMKYGTLLLWVAYSKTKSVAVHTPQGSTIVGIDGTLDSGGVLPGFKLAVKDVFGKKR
ncbi:MAG: Uma2 family endonuclease [Burkholderiales bacterium]|nr:Uma2 family endonuclease [Anaerolineae bacterium]